LPRRSRRSKIMSVTVPSGEISTRTARNIPAVFAGRIGVHTLRGDLGTLRADVARVRSRTATGLAGLKAELLRWMFLFWIGTVGPLLLAYLR
jgi:hypothetical protein